MTIRGEDLTITCADGFALSARAYRPEPSRDLGRTAIITAATGAKASYYWRYAMFLASHGFSSVVADYRGVGRSVPDGGLRGMSTRWHEWGTLDVDAVIGWALDDGPDRTVVAVGHSFGGLAVCLAPHARAVSRLLMVGAQHAHWPDYARRARPQMVWRWHLVMPVISTLLGFFPGRRLGWMEDVPRGVALDWARGRSNFARTIGRDGDAIMARLTQLDFDILAVAATDDPFATSTATDRLLGYLPHARSQRCSIAPDTVGSGEIGHLGLFHERFRDTLWPQSVAWLRGAECEAATRQGRGEK